MFKEGADYQNIEIKRLPLVEMEPEYIEEVSTLVEENVALVRADWDSYETSLDFKKNPLISLSSKVENAIEKWLDICQERFVTVKQNEERINQIFIEHYGLDDELTSDVNESEVSITRPEPIELVKDLISYAVGCMFGRYSLDKEGCISAGEELNFQDYYTFTPDKDNCIPITDEEYFEDDIVGLFCAWIKKAFGYEFWEENLDYIASVLGGKGSTSREIIRNYFANEFFKDHCGKYSVVNFGRRPIYWLFDSGKQNGFKALVYMHRWNADTVGNLRVEYLHKMQYIYEREIVRMQENIDNSRDPREVSKATKRKDKLQKQLKETKDYDAKLAHIALSRIEIDLDDGVKANYEKVQTGRDGKKMQILSKI